jgi:hypothetical protein
MDANESIDETGESGDEGSESVKGELPVPAGMMRE